MLCCDVNAVFVHRVSLHVMTSVLSPLTIARVAEHWIMHPCDR